MKDQQKRGVGGGNGSGRTIHIALFLMLYHFGKIYYVHEYIKIY